jgi:non-ribosomal peptide synthetase component F
MAVVALERTLYQRFSATVSEFGDHRALEARTERLTYRHLADLVAGRALEQSGAMPGMVGVLAGRGVLGYAGYLAALRIGATVVPLNPAHPPALNASIANGGRLDMVLANHAVTVCLFTSGSTGTPKGVPATHRGVSSFLAHATGRFEAGPGSRLGKPSTWASTCRWSRCGRPGAPAARWWWPAPGTCSFRRDS